MRHNQYDGQRNKLGWLAFWALLLIPMQGSGAATTIPNRGTATFQYGEYKTPIEAVNIKGEWVRWTAWRSESGGEPNNPIWGLYVCTGPMSGGLVLTEPYKAAISGTTDKCFYHGLRRSGGSEPTTDDVNVIKRYLLHDAPSISIVDNQILYGLKRSIALPEGPNVGHPPTPVADSTLPVTTAVTPWFNGAPQGKPGTAPGGEEKVRVDLNTVNWGVVHDENYITLFETNVSTITIY
ncbi:hypothetical protein DN085_01000 [Salmonella enterica subsp. enterica serovar Adelaide]|nr:hypothetical protein [Salmonella enterica subsp. enterica serovar Adelaide]